MSNCLTVNFKTSINEDINNLWSITCTNKNIQYDTNKSTKDVLKPFRNGNDRDCKTTSSHKVLSSQISSKTPRRHSIPYGHPPNPDFPRISLTSLSVTSTIPSLLDRKTWSDGVSYHLLIVPSAPLLNHSCMSPPDVKSI
jgi:hypothetical protein